MIELLKKGNGVIASMDIETIQYEDMNLIDPVAVIGFPTVGLASSIMANMYIKSLKMKPIAGMASSMMPPYCLITDSNILPPIRFFGYKNKRKNGHDVIVCMTEYSPKPEECFGLANRILMYLRQKGCRTVICLEGSPKYEKSRPMTVASGPNSAKLVKRSGVEPMTDGMIRGITGIMMYEAPNKGMDIISIMVPATAGIPDPGSAAQYIEPVAKLIPGFRTNPKELLKEAEILQNQMEDAERNMLNTSQYIG